MTDKKTLGDWQLNHKKKTSEEELIDSFKGKIIVLSGVPGVGKSTLGKQLGHVLDGIYYEEYVQSDLFNAYLANKEDYAFAYQLLMAHQRINIANKAIQSAQQGKAVIIDGPLACDNAFAKMLWRDGLISDYNYSLYQKILESEVGTKIVPPDYFVYLDCDEFVALERIKKRGRPGEYEAYSKNSFLSILKQTFSEVLQDCEVIVIPYDEDNVDDKAKIPHIRLIEILGLIRDKTFKYNGLPIKK